MKKILYWSYRLLLQIVEIIKAVFVKTTLEIEEIYATNGNVEVQFAQALQEKPSLEDLSVIYMITSNEETLLYIPMITRDHSCQDIETSYLTAVSFLGPCYVETDPFVVSF